MLFLPPIIGYGVLAVTLVAFVWAQRSGAVQRNSFVGIRTQKTLRSDAAWTAGHRAASPYLVGAATVSVLSGAGLAIIGTTGTAEAAGHVVASSGFFVVLAVALAGAVAAGRAADQA